MIAVGAAVYVTWRLGRGQLQVAQQQAAIAERQARLATVRLQHDLFDRRFAIYDAARNLIGEVVREGRISDQGLGDFVRGVSTAVFVLDGSARDYLDNMLERAIDLQLARSQVNALPVGDSVRATQIDREAGLKRWFGSQHQTLIDTFKPMMSLELSPTIATLSEAQVAT